MSAEEEVHSVRALWQQALEDYARETKRPLSAAQVAANRPVATAEDLAARIEASGRAFADFRAQRQRLWSTLRRFVAPISMMARIAVTPASTLDFGAASSAIAGAVAHLVTACEGVGAAYDWVEQVFRELLEFAERLACYLETPIEPLLQRKIVAILAFILKLIGHSERLIREGRFREYLRVTFLGKDVTTQKLLDELNLLFGSEQRSVLGMTYRSVRKTEAVTVGINNAVSETKEGMEKVIATVTDMQEKLSQSQINELLGRVLCNTSAHVDVEEILATNLRSLLKGTAGWLNEEPLFHAWLEDQVPVLYIFGGPGVGKSFLSTWLVRHLQEEVANVKMSVAYFFVRENNAVLQDPNHILKALAWQIAGQDPAFASHVASVCEKKSLLSTAESTWANLFLAFFASGNTQGERRVRIVIDGLDEAPSWSRRVLLGFAGDLASSSLQQTGIHLAVIGRKSLLDDLSVRELDKLSFIELTRAKSQHDISRYVQKRLQSMDVLHEIRKRKPNGPKKANAIGATIKKKIIGGADGVFLWARLLLDDLMKKDLPQIASTLADPPSTLDGMIHSVFERLDKDDEVDRAALNTFLSFMAHAQRPLAFGELYAAATVSDGKSRYLLWKHVHGKLSSIFDIKGIHRNQYFELVMTTVGNLENRDPAASIEDKDADSNSDNDSDSLFDFSGDGNDGIVADTLEVNDEVLSTTMKEDTKRDQLKLSGTSEYLFTPFTIDQLWTTITFCHTRIRDYLVGQKGDPQTRSTSLSVVSAHRNPHAAITILCLDMLRAGATQRKNWNFLRDVWFDDAKKVKDTASGLWSIAAQDWMDAASCSLEKLLGPSMRVASRLWLSKSGFDSFKYLRRRDDFPLWLLHGWLHLIREGVAPPEIEGPRIMGADTGFENLTVEQLENDANWAGLEHDAHWHCALGLSLIYRDYPDEASQHLYRALELDPNAWPVCEALARCVAHHGQIADAIQWHNEAIQKLPSRLFEYVANLRCDIAEWSIMIEDWNAAYDTMMLCPAFELTNPRVQVVTLKILRQRRDFESMLSLLERIHAFIRPSQVHNELVRLICTYPSRSTPWIATIYRAFGRPQFLLEAMQDAVRVLDDSIKMAVCGDEVRWPYAIGSFYFTHCGLTEEALRLLRLSLDRLSQQSEEQREGFEKEYCRALSMISIMHYNAAVSAYEETGKTDTASVAKLKDMALAAGTGHGPEREGFDIFHEGYPAMPWGCWLRDYERADEAVWRKCFRPRVLEHLNALDDDDPSNDQHGLTQLALTLLQAGDRTNGGAALAMLLRPVEARLAQLAEDGVQGSTEAAPSALDLPDTTAVTEMGSLSLGQEGVPGLRLHVGLYGGGFCCDGCRRNIAKVKELYFCEICDQVNWCDLCLPDLRDPERRVARGLYECDPKHSLYRGWPIPEEARYRAAESFENGVVMRKSWFENLRKEWWE